MLCKHFRQASFLTTRHLFYSPVVSCESGCLPSSFTSICSCVGANCVTMSKKNKVVTLNLETRLKVIEDASNGLTRRNLAEKYKCGKTTIQKILKEKVAIRERWMKSANKNQKRQTHQPYKEVNELTLAWFEGARARKIPINRRILQEKAISFARGLKIEKFSASSGWLERFCIRNNIVLKTLYSESESANENDATEWWEQLPPVEIKKEKEVEVDVLERDITETYNTNIEFIQVSNQEMEKVEIPSPVNRKKSCEDPPPIDEAYNIPTNASTTQRDECDIYGEYVAIKLRKLDAPIQSIVQHHINNILFEADMGKYNTLPLSM